MQVPRQLVLVPPPGAICISIKGLSIVAVGVAVLGGGIVFVGTGVGDGGTGVGDGGIGVGDGGIGVLVFVGSCVAVNVGVDGGGGIVFVGVASTCVFVAVGLPGPGVIIRQPAAVESRKQFDAPATSLIATAPLPFWSHGGQRDTGCVSRKMLAQRWTSLIAVVLSPLQSPCWTAATGEASATRAKRVVPRKRLCVPP
jgi:hypothetical protein